MTNELAPWEDQSGLPQKYDDKSFTDLTKLAAFIQRIQFMSPKSDICQTGKFPMNHYALVESKDNLVDIGEQVDCMPVAWRPKALEINGKETLIVYDPESDDFRRIFEASQQSQSKGFMCGPEFLLWVPSIRKFVTFFTGNKSTRIEATAIKNYIGKSATLRWRSAENRYGKWNTPAIQACSTPIDPPDLDEYKEMLDRFNNPPKQTVETVAEVKDDTERVR